MPPPPPHKYPDDLMLEVIARIAEQDRRSSLGSLSLVNRQLARLAQPQLFNSVSMCIQDDTQGLTFCERVSISPRLFEQTTELRLTEQRFLDERGQVMEDVRWRTSWLAAPAAAKMLQKLPDLSTLELDGFTVMDLGQFEDSMNAITANSSIRQLRISGGVIKNLNTLLGLCAIFTSLESLEIVGVRSALVQARGSAKESPAQADSTSSAIPPLQSLLIRKTQIMPQVLSQLCRMGCMTALRSLNAEISSANEAKEVLDAVQRVASTLVQLSIRITSSSTEPADVWSSLDQLEPTQKAMNLVSISGIRPRDVRWTAQLLEAFMPASNSRHVRRLDLDLHVHWPGFAKQNIWSPLDEIARRADTISVSVELVPQALSSKDIHSPTEVELSQQILPASRAHEDFAMTLRAVDHCTSIPESDDETPEPAKTARQWDSFLKSIESSSAPRAFEF